jgi:hypothetical protein
MFTLLTLGPSLKVPPPSNMVSIVSDGPYWSLYLNLSPQLDFSWIPKDRAFVLSLYPRGFWHNRCSGNRGKRVNTMHDMFLTQESKELFLIFLEVRMASSTVFTLATLCSCPAGRHASPMAWGQLARERQVCCLWQNMWQCSPSTRLEMPLV